jgi:hypothetical protein
MEARMMTLNNFDCVCGRSSALDGCDSEEEKKHRRLLVKRRVKKLVDKQSLDAQIFAEVTQQAAEMRCPI